MASKINIEGDVAEEAAIKARVSSVTAVVQEDEFNCCARLCRFNAELLCPCQHINEGREWAAILRGRPKDVRLAFVSMNITLFWLTAVGIAGCVAAWVRLRDDGLVPLEVAGGALCFDYCLCYYNHLMVNIVADAGAFRRGRGIYSLYGTVCALGALALGVVAGVTNVLAAAPAALLVLMAGCQFLCASFCHLLLQDELNGNVRSITTVQTTTAADGKQSVTVVEVVPAERYHFCERLCRYNSELLSPCKHLDTLDEWTAVMQGRPKNVRLASVSLNLVGLWLSWIGNTAVLVLGLTQGIYFSLGGWEFARTAVEWEFYAGSMGSSYAIGYALYFTVNVVGTRPWLVATRCAYYLYFLWLVCIAAAFGTLACTDSALFAFPAACFALKAFTGLFCASLVGTLARLTPGGSSSMV